MKNFSNLRFISKNWKKFLGIGIGLLISFAILIGIIIASIFGNQQANDLGSYGASEIPPAVKQYEEQITSELKKYGRENQINVLLAIVARESGGIGTADIMQSSESIGLPPNTIQDPVKSIEIGVKYFHEVLTQAEKANVDIDTAIQAYNMGNGYIDFVVKNGGKHSKDLAQTYSDKKKTELGWNTYGDPNYIENVRKYMGDSIKTNVGSQVAEGDLQNPYVHQEGKYVVTSEFNKARLNPVTKVVKPHNGIDLAPYGSDNLTIASAGEGVVIFANMYGDGTNAVEIQHTNGLYTKYLHLSKISVAPNQKVRTGDIIGSTGTTGNSTGVHLHFEIYEPNQNPVNPRNYIEW